MCITGQGKSLKLKVSSIRVMGHTAQGVRILNIDESDKVVGVDRIVRDESAEEPEPDSAVASVAAPAKEPTLFD
jgi:DNA gyrase subunit A